MKIWNFRDILPAEERVSFAWVDHTNTFCSPVRCGLPRILFNTKILIESSCLHSLILFLILHLLMYFCGTPNMYLWILLCLVENLFSFCESLSIYLWIIVYVFVNTKQFYPHTGLANVFILYVAVQWGAALCGAVSERDIGSSWRYQQRCKYILWYICM